MNLKGRDFLTLLDYTPEEIAYLVDLAAELKAKKKAGVLHDVLRGKNVALIFEKTSTRTRCSFEVAAHDLGMGSTYLDPTGSQIGKKESIADTAQVLCGMFDGIEYRGYGQEIVNELAKYSTVPVWNGLTNEFHPTQILADFLTIKEHFGKLAGLKFAYMGDARYNMGNSLMIGCAKMGLHFVACAPKAYWPASELVEKCKAIAAETGATITLSDDTDAVKDADVVYTDVWVSMGEPVEVWAERIEALAPYQVNTELMAKAKPTAVFMHCLPAYHDHKTAVGREMGEKFDRDAMEEMCNGAMKPAYSMITEGMQFFSEKAEAYFKDNLSNNVEEAKRLLAEAGYTMNGEGYLEKDGSVLEFTFLSRSSGTSVTVAQEMQLQLQEIGIKMNIETIDWNYIYERMADDDYDAGIAVLEWAEAILVLNYAYYDPNTKSDADMQVYKDLVEKAATSSDMDQAVEYVYEAQMEMFKDCAIVPLYSDVSYCAYRNDINGLVVCGDGSLFYNDINYAG